MLAEYGFEVVSQVGDAEQLLRAVETHRPDVAICECRRPLRTKDCRLPW